MTGAEAQLILGFLPIAEQMISKVVAAVDDRIDTSTMTLGEIKTRLEATAADKWPELGFTSPNKG